MPLSAVVFNGIFTNLSTSSFKWTNYIYYFRERSSESCIILLQAVTINANSWTDAGHSVNQIYDILYMMGRDDIAVGVGGDGGILEDGTILPNVGGYIPIIDQV